MLIPSFNPGAKVFSTVRAALDQWAPVWVVVDGSTDHSELRLAEMAAADPNRRVWVLPKNGGKGAAEVARLGLQAAEALDAKLASLIDRMTATDEEVAS